MTTSGLLVRLHAQSGKDQQVAKLLRSALPMVEEERDTTAWFAFRFGRGDYGIFDTFPDDEAREAHLNGPVAQGLLRHSDELLDSPIRIKKVRVLADKLPVLPPQPDTKGLLLTFKAKPGQEPDVEQFLHRAQEMVLEEPETTAWFAIQTEEGEYGIFDVFPDNGGRFVHLVGHVPRELAKHSLKWFGAMPELEMLSVQAEKLSS
jgi:quinol monooxygenase YgiN